MGKIKRSTRELLIRYADKYETEAFLDGDPSWFMHQVEGDGNRELTAFIASCLSYGSRKQFMQKGRTLLEWSGGDMDAWVRSGRFEEHFRPGETECFYRLYSCGMMYRLLCACRELLAEYGTVGAYVRRNATDAPGALEALCRRFAPYDLGGIVPKDTRSACKRLCMFLRWMVRDNSPVDLGLWAGFIDRRSLIVPLDTHVLRQSVRLGLLGSRTASMHSARELTSVLAGIFPEDPLKGDFALFGLGLEGKQP